MPITQSANSLRALAGILTAGQVVAQEIYNSRRMFLIQNGRELTNTLISKIAEIYRLTPLNQKVRIYY